VSRLVADTELAREVLGFQAEVDIDEGLRLMLKHYEVTNSSNSEARG
jgi:nucleoside-diphosphate-sugar epimerase